VQGGDLLYFIKVKGTHSQTPGLPWTRVLSVAEMPTCTTTKKNTTDKYPCLRPGSNPQPEQTRRRRPTPQAAPPPGPAPFTNTGLNILC